MTEVPAANHSAARWNPWPVSIILFFAIAILGFALFIGFCLRNPSELVTPDYYEQELRYQAQIDKMNNAAMAAGEASVRYDAGSRNILISLPGTVEATSATGDIHLYRPAAVDQDRRLKLQLDTAGTQRIDATNLPQGLWKVRVSWSVGQQQFFIDRKLVIGPQSS